MSDQALADVFTIDELARAAGVPVAVARAVVASGALRPVAGTTLFAASDIVRAAPALREAAAGAAPPPSHAGVGRTVNRDAEARPSARLSVVASSCAHGLVLLLILLLASGSPASAPAEPVEEPQLVFLVIPGPGGGGGGSGRRESLPAPRLERRGPSRASISTPRTSPDPVLPSTKREDQPTPPAEIPKPAEQPLEPLASTAVIAPIVMAAVSPADRAGVVAPKPDAPSSLGPGSGSNAGAGRGEGAGEGTGSGIGPGSGGGTGGGPYRPGSGIQPPRLLREVKADYTEDARRRGLTGDVVLEIVVQRDGRVGAITLKRGLGAGLDERAIAAVRQWEFAPATRLGAVVDVIVEVAVEFNLR
jgi:TonB family protein